MCYLLQRYSLHSSGTPSLASSFEDASTINSWGSKYCPLITSKIRLGLSIFYFLGHFVRKIAGLFSYIVQAAVDVLVFLPIVLDKLDPAAG